MIQITAEHHNFKVIQLWEPEAAPVFARARQTQRRNLAHPCREFTLECARAWPRSPRVSESVCLSVGGQTSNDRDDDDWREIEFACNPLPSSTSFPPLTVPEREVCILGRFCFCKALLRPSAPPSIPSIHILLALEFGPGESDLLFCEDGMGIEGAY